MAYHFGQLNIASIPSSQVGGGGGGGGGAMNCSSTMSKVSTGFWLITRLLFLTETPASEAPPKFIEDFDELYLCLTLMCVEYDGYCRVSSNADMCFVSTMSNYIVSQ